MTETTMSPALNRMEKLKNGAAILGALASAVVGLFGVYEKVRSEARADTAASYNTLAPQVNQLGDALKELQQENQKLREIVAHGQGKPRLAAVLPTATPRRRDSSAPAREAPAATAPAGEAPAAPAAPPAQNPESPTAAAPAAPVAPAAPAPEGAPAEPAAATEDDRITGLLRAVGRTREAIESLKKVPEDFGTVVGKPE